MHRIVLVEIKMLNIIFVSILFYIIGSSLRYDSDSNSEKKRFFFSGIKKAWTIARGWV